MFYLKQKYFEHRDKAGNFLLYKLRKIRTKSMINTIQMKKEIV